MNKPLFASYLLIINIIAFFLYRLDKKNANRGKTRIPVFVLLWMARLGGGLGAWFSMSLYHHKKNHTKFRRLVPLWIMIWLLVFVIFVAFSSGDFLEEMKSLL